MTPEILLFIIKLTIGAIIAFLAILLMSKNRDAAWMNLVAGFLFSYASLIFDFLIKEKILSPSSQTLFGIPISSLICAIIPSVFFIIAFIIMLSKK